MQSIAKNFSSQVKRLSLHLRKDESPTGAIGKYQILQSSLIAQGWFCKRADKSLEATEKAQGYGVNNLDDFKKNLGAQELAMDEYLEGNYRDLKDKKCYDYIGKEIEGPKGKFTISEKSIMAAAHREGVGGLRKFMNIEAAHNYSIKDFGHLSPQEKETMSGVASYKESGETVMNAIHHRLKIFAA